MKKKILIVILILLIILAGIVVYLGVFYNKKNAISDKRLRELYDNSYLLYLLTEGDISKIYGDKGYQDNGTKYNSIEGVNNLGDISKLINNTMSEIYRSNYRDMVINDRDYRERNNTVYVRIDNLTFCDSRDIKYEDLKVTYKDDYASITDGNFIIDAYYENGDWYLTKPLFFCNPDIGEE